MQIFHNRPLALAECLFAVTAVAIWQLQSKWKLLLLVVCLIFSFSLLLFGIVQRKWGKRLVLCTLCLLFILLAIFGSYLFFNVHYAKLQQTVGTDVVAEGYVLERIGSGSYYAYYRVRLSALNDSRVYTDAVLECNYPSALQIGDCFHLNAVPREYTKDEYFNEETFRLSDGCLLVLTCSSAEDCEILANQNQGIFTAASLFNLRLSYRLREAVGGEAGGLAAALLLGNRTWLSEDTVLHFRSAGVSHLLALSGLHVSVLIMFLDFLLLRFRIPKTVRVVAVFTAALGYMALTGFSPSICRAVLMLCISYLAFLVRAQYDAFTAICTALTVLLLAEPYAVLDLSLWMSFLSAGGIIVFVPPLTEAFHSRLRKKQCSTWLFRALSSVFATVMAGLAATFSISLLSATVFGEISVWSVPVTCLLSVPVSALLIGSVFTTLFSSVPLCSAFCSACSKLILRFCGTVFNADVSLLPAGDVPTRLILAVLTVAVVLLAVLKLRRMGRWMLLPVALVVCAMLSSLAVTHFSSLGAQKETVFSNSRGEAVLYTERGEAVLVCDFSGSSTMAYEIQSTARTYRCTQIDDMVLSKYYNQASYLIAEISSQIRVKRLHLPTPTDSREEAIAARLCQEAELHGICVSFDAAQVIAKCAP